MSYVVNVTIPAGKVASTLTNFVTRIDLADMPADWWADTTSDLGNVRVKSAGTVIPFDVVWFNRTTRKGELYFKSTLSTSANVFTVEAVLGATALAATDPNGRNAVWSDYDLVVMPGSSLDNRTGGISPTLTGELPTHGPIEISAVDVNTHNGLAVDGDGNFYLSDTSTLRKYDKNWNLLATVVDAFAFIPGAGAFHLNDCVVVGTELFVPYDGNNGRDMVSVWKLDLTYDRVIDPVIAGHFMAGLTYCSADGFFYSVDYAAAGDSLIHKWDSTFTVHSTIATGAVPYKQGITYHQGFLWVTSDPSANDGIYKIALDGSSTVLAVNTNYVNGATEGIDSDGEFLYLLRDPGTDERVFKLAPSGGEYGQFFDTRGYLKAVGLAKRTAWSGALTAQTAIDITANRTAAVYGTNDATSGNFAGIIVAHNTSPDRWGTWTSTDSWLDDTTVSVAAFSRGRFVYTHNATTDRRIWRDGVNTATDLTVGQRPGGLGDTFIIGAGNGSGADPWSGRLQRIYLRNGILSADWIAAEYASWESPASFYEVAADSAISGPLAVAFPAFGVDMSGDASEFVPDLDVTLPAFRFTGSADVDQAGALTATFPPLEVETIGSLPDVLAGDLLATFPKFRASFVAEQEDAIGTVTAYDLNGRVRAGIAYVSTDVAVEPVPAGLSPATKVDKALAYPTPDLVDGRPT